MTLGQLGALRDRTVDLAQIVAFASLPDATVDLALLFAE
jgi:hypothetical protein